MHKNLFTSESVTVGHPDKMCDKISDSILDAYLAVDKNARVACESAAKNNTVMVFGEVTSTAQIDVEKIVRNTIREIGYTDISHGIDADTCEVMIILDKQSPDIDMGVSVSYENKHNYSNYENIQSGAGDQGMMFGYACKETVSYMPAPIYYAHKLAQRLEFVRKNNIIKNLRPDGKTQVTFEYDKSGNPIAVDTIVVSTQHDDKWDMKDLKNEIYKHVIQHVFPNITAHTKIYVNPTGRFVIGGPTGDSGLTGRKIIVDTYGGYAPHGGGAFSGKDPSKVDRSAAYMTRYVAKNIVAAGLADRCQIQVAYAIGVAEPVSIKIDTFGTEKYPLEKITETVDKIFDLRPSEIVKQLNLKNPIYAQLAAYGHIGRDDIDIPWERTDKANLLKEIIKMI